MPQHFPSLCKWISGWEEHNSQGSFFLAEESLDLYRESAKFLEAFPGGWDNRWAILLETEPPGDIRMEEAVFLDTETTGLSIKNGAFPFMIGVGLLREGQFVIRQFFCRDHTEESAALAALTEEIRDRRFLFTFNGKAFDLNLLKARYVLNRQPNLLAGLTHLDLLHQSRRLLAHRLDSHRLQNIEERILGIHREHDLPGAEIPSRYFMWLARRDPRLVVDIFRHNRQDILMLVFFLGYFSRMAAGLDDPRTLDAGDILAWAKLFARRDKTALALALLLEIPMPDRLSEKQRNELEKRKLSLLNRMKRLKASK